MRELIHSGQLAGHFAVVLGAGASGLAAARLLSALGARVRVVDRNAFADHVRAEAETMGWELLSGEHAAGQFQGLDLLVVSPGVPVAKLADVLAGVPESKIIGELELASWFCPVPVLAVTGTSGKTTTVSLIGAMLEQAGVKAFVGGNIGTPLSSFLLQEQIAPAAQVAVLEVSSFQLMHARSFKPHVAVLINISPNHLDYHADMEEYVSAKLKLFAKMGPDDLAIVPLELKDELERREFTRAKRQYFVPSKRFAGAKLLGAHNQANLEAAWLAARAFGVSEADAARAAEAFEPLPNRLEPVAQVSGVLYVNDSKATTVSAMGAALESFDRPVRLLAGGVWKGGEPQALLPLIRERVASVGLFGGAREQFEAAWAGQVDMQHHETLEGAVRAQAAMAMPGDVILLSPATSSFDQYPSYKARGDDFKRVVELLSQESAARGEDGA